MLCVLLPGKKQREMYAECQRQRELREKYRDWERVAKAEVDGSDETDRVRQVERWI